MAVGTLIDAEPVARRTRREQRRDRRWEWGPLALPPVVAAIATLFWVPFDRFLAAGDVTPFLRDGVAHELTSYWNHRANGAGGTSPVIARSVEVAFLRLVALAGGPETLAQHLFFAALMAFAAFGAAYLARAFVASPLAVATAGLLGVFNPFVLVRLPNPVPLVWLGLVATLAGLLVRAARGAPRSAIGFAFATLPASYLSVNPPLLIVAAVTLLAVTAACSALVGPGGTRRAARFLARSLPWCIVLNLWWLVPTVLSTFARQGIAVAAETRVEDWAWSHGQNTVGNVVTLTADWGWKYPEYLPFAPSLDAAPWSWLRWILPLLALAAPLVTTGRRRIAALTLVVAGLVGAFIAKGLHPPLVSWNLWLYHHVPGMWLLREPASKAGGLVLLAEIVLAAMTLTALFARFTRIPRRRRSPRTRHTLGIAVLGGAVCLALAFPYPVWAGGFGSDGTMGLPADDVAVPSAWHDLAADVNSSPVRGKVLVLPLDPYYQVTTTWGFHGADELVKDLIRRPVLQLLPGGYFSPAGDVPAMLHATEDALTSGDADRAETLLRMLGVSHVIVRHDIVPGPVIRSTADPKQLDAGLQRIPGLAASRDYGVADVRTVSDGAPLAWIPEHVTGLVRRDPTRRADALADLGPDTAAVAPSAALLDALSWEAADSPESHVRFRLRNAGVYQLALAETTPARRSARVVADAGGARLELADPVTVKLDGIVSPPAPSMVVPLTDDRADVIEIDGRTTALDGHDANVKIAPRSSVRALGATPTFGSPASSFTPVGTCSPRRPGAAPTSTPISRGVDLRASAGIGCTTVPVPALSSEGIYRVQFKLRVPNGSATRFACLWQDGPERSATIEQPTTTRAWSTFDQVVRTEPGVSALTLFLYAQATDGPVDVQYRDVSITPLRTVGLATVDSTARPPLSRFLARGDHTLGVSRPSAALVLRPDSPLGDCNRSDSRSIEKAGLDIRSIAGGVRLSARAHAACVNAPLPDVVAGDDYTLELDVRTVSGARARVCVWEFGPNHCAEIEDLPASDSWTRYRTNVEFEPGTRAARIYLYADGQDDATTVAEYRNLTLRPLQPNVVELRPQDVQPPSTPASPSVAWRQHGSDSFEVDLGGAARGRVLVVDESFASGWRLDGARVSAHVLANGYANAWVLETTKPSTVTARFGPSRYTDFAIVVSILAAIVALAVVLLMRRRSRRAAVIPDF